MQLWTKRLVTKTSHSENLCNVGDKLYTRWAGIKPKRRIKTADKSHKPRLNDFLQSELGGHSSTVPRKETACFRLS